MHDIIRKHPSDDNISLLFDKSEMLYRFVLMYYNYCIKTQDYGFGNEVTMVEAHTVTMINDHPGITISQLASHYNRTTSAISQLATKLEKKGLITRKMISNLKNIHLYTTPEGDNLSKLHKIYDSNEVIETLHTLSLHCTPQEVDAFFKVLQEYIAMLKN